MFLEDTSELSRWSCKKVLVRCDFRQAELCLENVTRRFCDVQKNMKKNNGKYICHPCSTLIKQSGRNGPSCKYKNLDDYLMDIIDSEEKAYLLGWIAADGSLSSSGTVCISVSACDIGVLQVFRSFICSDLPIVDSKGNMKLLRICSSQWCKSIKKHLNLSFKKGESHKKSHLVQMPVEISDSFKWGFLRGLFEGDGCIEKCLTKCCYNLRVRISSTSMAMRMMIVTFCRASNINISMNSNDIQLSGQYAARFLEKIYAECNERFVLNRKYDIYKQLRVELSRFWERAAIAEEAYLTPRMENLVIERLET